MTIDADTPRHPAPDRPDRGASSGDAITSYAAAGVDIEAGERAVELMRPAIAATSKMANAFGAFGAAVQAPGLGMLLVSSADGVGTKLCLAQTDEECAGLGRDLVHHCIDDILTCGARPLFFLDYLAFGKLVPERAAAIVRGMSTACSRHGCALIGGETAELPDIYRTDAFDLAGFIVGTVPRDELITGSQISAGDVLVGLPSAGLHTNGFSLARALLAGRLDEPVAAAVQQHGLGGDRHGAQTLRTQTWRDVLLAEHRCYLPAVAPLLDAGVVLGMAHITGGGLPGNVPRMLPAGLAAKLDPTSWHRPPLFDVLAGCGVSDREMFRTFNLGIGMVLACRAAAIAEVLRTVDGAVVIGSVDEDRGEGRVLGLW